MQWTKGPGEDWKHEAPPDGRFVVRVHPKGDGRWMWSVFAGGRGNAMATGTASSLAAAKNVTEQFLKRNGAG